MRGRLTRAQERSLQTLAPLWQISADETVSDVFERPAPLGIEIGFGMGHALVEWARSAPDMNLVGVEVYRPGIGALLGAIDHHSLTNVRIIEGEAANVLATTVEPASVDEIRVFFPDPWPKRKHHKRRLITPDFVAMLADRLKPGGRVWLATDWADYARWMLKVLDKEPMLEAVNTTEEVADNRAVTRYESRGRRLGHDVQDFVYQRKC
jgi:tRNA (guanine-N7-)-methyltransferase